MRNLTLLSCLTLLVAFWATPTYACDKGDEKVGPYCAAEQWVQIGLLKKVYTTVYTGEASSMIELWDGFGSVKSCTLDALEIFDSWGEIQVYKWDPKSRTYR